MPYAQPSEYSSGMCFVTTCQRVLYIAFGGKTAYYKRKPLLSTVIEIVFFFWFAKFVHIHGGFEVLTAVAMKVAIIWDVA
jgi:hypothetical protein